MPLILPGNVASATAEAYEVANSCRFNDGDSAYMHKTPGGAGDRRQWTFSAWIKRGQLGTSQYIFNSKNGSADQIFFNTSDKFQVGLESISGDYVTTAVFRDCSAWYHFLVAVDTDQGTAASRVRVYVNGTEVTSFSTETDPNQNTDTTMNTTEPMELGRRISGSTDFFDGYMAEVVFIDGTQYAASDFGEFNEDSPTIWQPVDPSGLTFGTNGFYLDFEASGNLGNDVNGGTDLTEVNLAATDQAADSPTNNWCVMNPLDNFYAGSTFSEGNLKIATASSTRTWVRSTLGVNTGKWYWEQKLTVESTDSSEDDVVGIVDSASTGALLSLDSSSSCPGLALRENGQIITYLSGTSVTGGTWNTFDEDDIVNVALDLDNNKIYFGTNGTWGNSSDPAAGSNGFAFTHADTGVHDDFWYCAVSIMNNNSANTYEVNFGCPTFAISSSNADADGYGNFEYAVPSGYYALCSKNLGAYGG